MTTATEVPANEQTTTGKADVIESINPADGSKIGEVPLSTTEDVVAAVARARKGQKSWYKIGAAGRAEVLLRLKQVMFDRAEEIVTTISNENGKPRAEAMTMILSVSEALEYYAKLGRKLEGGKKVSAGKLFSMAKTKIFFEPRGVAGFIMPWNFPFELGMKHMIPALMAGNAVVQKPSEFNPLIGNLIQSLYIDAGVPEDVIQMVHGYAEVGVALIDNVDVVTFIGSPQTGKRIMERASQRLIPVVLELGGNDAALVCEDADLDKAAKGLVTGACLNAGQTCISVERIYAHKKIASALSDKIVEQAKKLKQNTGDEFYDVGPIKWKPQRKIYEEHLKDAIDKGAEVKLGGQAIENGNGAYWQPTVLTGMKQEMEMMKEETFGPFIPIMEVESDEEGLRLANDCSYGLGGSVWTRNTEKGERYARQMTTGSVCVNNALVQAACPTLPFGGNGLSGVGRAFGEIGFYNYTSPRSVMIAPSGKMGELGWMPYPKTSEKNLFNMGKMLFLSKTPANVVGGLKALKNITSGK